MTQTRQETGQPVLRRRVGPERAALVLAMAVVIAAAIIRQAPVRRQLAREARAEAHLLTAKAQTLLVCFYGWLEARGYQTRSRLIDAAGFRGEQASVALAEAAVAQYEYVIERRPDDWEARANAAILYGYLGRDYEGVLVLQEGLSLANLPEYWFLLRIYAHERPKPAWLELPEFKSIRCLPAGPLVLQRLYQDLGQPEKAADALDQGFRRGLRAVAFFLVLLALLVAGLGVWIAFLAVRPWRKPVQKEAAPWSVFDAVEVLVLWTFISLLSGWAATRLIQRGAGSPALVTAAAYVAAAVLAVAWFFAVALRTRRPSEVGWRSASGVLAGIAGNCATWPLLFAVVMAMRAFLADPTPASPALPIVAGAESLPDKIWVAALALLAAPVFEETLFRGILYGALRKIMRPTLGMILSGALFGLAHLDLVAALPLAALGVVFAYLYERTNSLVAPAVAHAMTNAGTVALTLIV